MAPLPRCDRCRAPLALGLLGGVCPACVFRDAQAFPFEAEAEGSEVLFPDASGDFHGPTRKERGGFPRDFGAYTLLEQIGQGGMGVVYRALHRILGRQVALKLLIAGEFSSPDFVDRFRREAATAASLRHPGIVAVHEAGEVSGQPFLALELVEGITLADRIRERPLPPREAARYLRAVAEAVQHAHDHGLLHRDLKPANILLDGDDHPRVTDFGLAKRLDGSTDLTLTGQMLGSPHYLSPEAVLGGRSTTLTPAADVYSLGATLYHVLTGRPPLLADSLAETLAQVRDRVPVPPRLLNPAIPRDLETICVKCLEKAPAQRYSSAREFAEDLARWEQGEPIRARPATPLERASKWMRRHPARTALAGMVILSGAALTAGSLWFNVRLTAARDEANANRRRAEASQREAEASEAAGRARLIRMQVATANRLVSEGDPLAAALWSAAALEAERGGAGELPHRRRLAAQWAMAPRLVNLAPGSNPDHFGSYPPDPTHSPFRIETQTDGKLVVLRADGVAVRFSDRESGGAVDPSTAVPGSAGARAVTLVPSGHHLHVQDAQGRHCTWDLLTGRLAAPPVASEPDESPPSFRPDGLGWVRYFSRADQWLLEFHPIGSEFHPPRSLSLNSHPFAMEFDPAGRWLMTAHWDGAVRLWSPDTLEILAVPVRSSGGFSCATISPDGSKLATGGWNQEAQVWTLPAGRPVTPPLRLGMHVAAVEFSRDGRYLAVRGGDGMTRTWDLHLARRPTLPDSTLGPGTSFWNLVSNGRGVVAASDRSDRMHFWVRAPNEETGFRHQAAERPLSEDRSALTHLEVSQDGQLAALTQQSGHIVLWEVSSGRLRHQFQHGPSEHLFLVISPDSHWLASAGTDGVVHCWDVASGALAFPAFQQGSPVGRPAFSPDSRRLVIPAKDGAVRILDRQTGARLGPPLIHDHWALNADFSPDGAHVVTAEGDHSAAALGAQVWEVSSGRKIGAPMQHSDGVSIVRYFPDGARILTAGEDGQARVWSAADGSPQTPWMRGGRRIFRAEISADGLMIATLDEGGRLRLWDARNGELLSASPVQEPVAHATFADADRVVYSDPGTGALHWLSLPVAQGSVADLAALARVSAGFEIDATGGLAPLPVETLAQLHERLRIAMPGHFQVRLHDPEWHRQELARATAAEEPFAIRFHAEALAKR